MSTSISRAIERGVNFKGFVKSCAKNFGPLISMKEEPEDADFPTEIKPSGYHLKELAYARAKLIRHKTVTKFHAARHARKEYEDKIKFNLESLRKNAALLAKCKKLILKIKDWDPPTLEHNDLKDFMITHIDRLVKQKGRSIKYTFTPVLKTAEQWLKEEVETIVSEIEYHDKEYKEEVKNAKRNTKWIQDLLKSL